jgi:hypothetical protein
MITLQRSVNQLLRERYFQKKLVSYYYIDDIIGTRYSEFKYCALVTVESR